MTRCPSCGKRLRDDTRACASLLEEACADAEKNAAIVLPRPRRQIDRLAAPASASR